MTDTNEKNLVESANPRPDVFFGHQTPARVIYEAVMAATAVRSGRMPDTVPDNVSLSPRIWALLASMDFEADTVLDCWLREQRKINPNFTPWMDPELAVRDPDGLEGIRVECARTWSKTFFFKVAKHFG